MISIIYEDDHLLIVNKPSGITVNKADTTQGEITVQDWAEEHIAKNEFNFNISQGDFFNRGGIVHRLDKETSGVLIIAKNPDAFVHLQQQFKERIVKKKYLALAHGNIAPDSGVINVPVGRLPWNRRQFGVVAGGREAVTRYNVLSSKYIDSLKEYLTYLEVFPETGRTHQIRVHLKYIGHPIFADFLYAGRKTQRNDRKLLSRVFLHAAGISIYHPLSLKEVYFESPLPPELTTVLKLLE